MKLRKVICFLIVQWITCLVLLHDIQDASYRGDQKGSENVKVSNFFSFGATVGRVLCSGITPCVAQKTI